ncbi:MAG: Osmosensitive K+ channel histidine kinase KdpD [uncultured Actinomycetospora sp.]|uniref:histidine kinase n=1 Tax=uncultured Actinomycetospora sp. TaxID=1135996 RepID=A0A6J4IWQ1_9PSEU|nr:MAG: Osmosensitive K+ channel histidine kinase KdpD [uncultured Actinomycetospora sp.]
MSDGRRRGELRIHLGAAPGVGKTYAALNEAHRRVERGTDVVVGLVETHGRARTAALLEGLEVLPRKDVDHRGTEFSELDVDAVLARAPEVCVVDELAHSCAPGSRHAKRWEDVEELLEAGIDVISTVNVQHLESLGDVVERITGVRQRETIPDAVVRAADQIELVDITPEALRRRMAHGNIYRPEKVDASLANWFRTGNLIALRELALLWVADQVDVALQRYRTAESISEVWEARERVVVAVTGGPESATVMRRAARIARRAGSADLLCVHVLRGDGLARRDDGAGAGSAVALRRLAEDVGASFHTVVGDDVPAALLEFARAANATQLVLGTSRRSRWARLFDPGIGARTTAESGSIDVHLVSHTDAGGRRSAAELDHAGPTPRRRLSLPARRHAFGWPAAVLLPVLATVIGVVLRDAVDLSTDVVLFFLATVVTAMIGGLAPALVAALGGGLLLNVFLTPPLYTLSVSEPENGFAIGAMVVVALLVAAVVDRADRRAGQASTARAEATLLTSFARVVLSRSDPLPKLLERVREAFGLTAVALMERGPQAGWEVTACTGGVPCTRPADADVDVEIDEGVHLVGTGRTLTASERALFAAVSGQALLALRNRRMAAQATDAQRRADAAGLRTALLSAVGHDLRTPLTAIKAAAGSLRDPVLRMSTADRQELLATVEESADRLTALVDNLLDSSRLATGAVTPIAAPVALDEVVAAALTGVDPAGADRVVVEVGEDLPAVLADAGLAERIVANLVDNALRHGGGGAVAVRASAYADRVELRVVDAGPGVPRKQLDRLFTPFQQLGDRRRATGVGLGLHVARGFAEAMGGTLDAEDTPGGGLTMVLSLPAAALPVWETQRSGARPVSSVP